MAETPISTDPHFSQTEVPGPPKNANATELIHQKQAQVYAEEPIANQALHQKDSAVRRSRYQQFIYDLRTSGKNLETIQTEWRNYYANLPNDQKNEVWQEFNESTITNSTQATAPSTEAQVLSEHNNEMFNSEHLTTSIPPTPKLRDTRIVAQINGGMEDKVAINGKSKVKRQLQPLLFGLGTGTIVLFLYLFTFFNQTIIAPFIQPSRLATASPIILNSSTIAPTSTPDVIIPKINVQIPVIYTEISTNEADIENDLEKGVVHYPGTAFPGQTGNAAFFGHSSNNIFNPGKYKFAFALLHTLVNDDTFYLIYKGKIYIYKVISHSIVPPSEVSVLGHVSGQTAIATLITCDPPGTSINRLVVVGKQISPDPTTNTAAATTTTTNSSPIETTLPGNGPSLWTRISRTAIGKLSMVTILAMTVAFIAHRIRHYLILLRLK